MMLDMNRLAEIIVVSAFNAHPECPDAAEACALQLVDALCGLAAEALDARAQARYEQRYQPAESDPSPDVSAAEFYGAGRGA